MRTESPQRASSVAIWGALSLVYAIWGSTYLAIRVAIRTLPPLMMSGVRFLIAGGALYAFAIRRGDRSGDRPGGPQWRAAAIVGGTLLLGGNGAVVIAEQHISSGLAALLVAMVPIWMALIGRAVYKERLTGMAAVGLVIGFSGLVVLVNPGNQAHVSLLGVGLLVFASLSWSSGSLYARRAPLPSRPLVATAMEMLAGGAMLLLAGVIRGEVVRFHPSSVQATSVAAWLYLVTAGSLLGFTAYAWLIRVARTSLVGTYAYVNPVVAVFLGWVLLDERVTIRTVAAGTIIVFGVALIVTSRASSPITSEPVGSPADTPPPPEK